MSIICKTIYTSDKGVCIYNTDFISKKNNKNERIYQIPELGIYIDELNYKMFTSSDERFFFAVSIPGINPMYKSLIPLSKEKHKKLPLEKGDYKYIHPKNIGEGAFGSVKGFETEKSILKTPLVNTRDIPQDIIKEIAIYRLLKEITCIPKLQGFSLSPEIKIQLEKGMYTLYDALEKKEELKMDTKMKMMLRLAKCLHVIASQGVINLDLKPENMIITEKNQIQIIDWGLAEIPYNSFLSSKEGGTKQSLYWRAPEICLNSLFYNYKADIFSLGIIFIQIYQQNMIPITYKGVNDIISYCQKLMDILLDIQSDDYYEDDELILGDFFELVQGQSVSQRIFKSLKKFNFPDDFNDLLSKMLEFNHLHRINYKDIILHPFFQKIERQSISDKYFFPLEYNIYINSMPKININNTENRILDFYDIYKIFLNKRFSLHTLLLSFQLYDLININVDSFKYAEACLVIASKLFEDSKHLNASNPAHEKHIVELLNGNLLILSLALYKFKNVYKVIGFYGRKDVYLTSFDKVNLNDMIFIKIANSIGLTVHKDEFKLDNNMYVSNDIAIFDSEFEEALNEHEMIYTKEFYKSRPVITFEFKDSYKLPSLKG